MLPIATSKRDLLRCDWKRWKNLNGKVYAESHGKRCSLVCGTTSRNYEQDIEYRSEEGLQGAISRFHERHHQFYGYHFEDETIELVHLKVSISEAAQHPKINLATTSKDIQSNVPRLVYESATHALQMPVYRREGLSVGSRFSGPAIIEEIDSTTFIPSGTELYLDENYNLILTLI